MAAGGGKAAERQSVPVGADQKGTGAARGIPATSTIDIAGGYTKNATRRAWVDSLDGWGEKTFLMASGRGVQTWYLRLF